VTGRKIKVGVSMVVTTPQKARFHVRIYREKDRFQHEVVTEFVYEVEGDFRDADHAELVEAYMPVLKKVAEEVYRRIRERRRKEIRYPVVVGEIEE